MVSLLFVVVLEDQSEEMAVPFLYNSLHEGQFSSKLLNGNRPYKFSRDHISNFQFIYALMYAYTYALGNLAKP